MAPMFSTVYKSSIQQGHTTSFQVLRRFGNYCKLIWHDAVFIALVALACAGIYELSLHQSSDRLFPLRPSRDEFGTVYDLQPPPEYSYPWLPDPCSNSTCALLVTIIPIMIIGVFQLRFRSLPDFHAGLSGILKAVVVTYIFLPPLGCLAFRFGGHLMLYFTVRSSTSL